MKVAYSQITREGVKFYSVVKASELSGSSRRVIADMVKRNTISNIREGGVTYIPETAVSELIYRKKIRVSEWPKSIKDN